MKLFLDTANLDEVRHIARLGVLDGVTTNPSLLAKEHGIDFRDTIREIAGIVGGHVSAEVTETSVTGIVAQGRDIATWDPNVVVKIPVIEAGIEAISVLTNEGVAVNTTLIFNPNQALIAARAGASFVSPFVGRFDDISEDGIQVVADIVEIFAIQSIDCQVLAASLRGPFHVTQAAKVGADIATMPYKVFLQCLKHPLTDLGLARFLADWEKVKSAAPAVSGSR